MSARRLGLALFLVLAFWAQPSAPQAAARRRGTAERIHPVVCDIRAFQLPSRRCASFPPHAHASHSLSSERAGVALESISPDVGTAHAITSVVFHGNGLEQKLPTLGCRFGDRVVAPLERFNHSVRCLCCGVARPRRPLHHARRCGDRRRTRRGATT